MSYRRFPYFFLSASLCLTLAACSPGNTQKPVQEPKETKPAAENHQTHWSYEGKTGPEHWGELDPTFSTCANGTAQSPINIEDPAIKEIEESEKITIDYQPTTFTLMNNGHTIQANAKTANNSIILDGTAYKLVQLHFHTPSEHQLDGKNFDMELHLVHKSDKGNLAVVGVMIKEGKENKALSDIWANMPKKETNKDIELNKEVDVRSLLPDDQDSFLYNGSLTTPPCTEGVQWIVLEDSIEMSKEQIAAFRTIFPDDHRPVQPLNNREVTEQDE
jgi:carbonic anhydrase